MKQEERALTTTWMNPLGESLNPNRDNCLLLASLLKISFGIKTRFFLRWRSIFSNSNKRCFPFYQFIETKIIGKWEPEGKLKGRNNWQDRTLSWNPNAWYNMTAVYQSGKGEKKKKEDNKKKTEDFKTMLLRFTWVAVICSRDHSNLSRSHLTPPIHLLHVSEKPRSFSRVQVIL